MMNTEQCFLISPDMPDLEFHMCEVTGKADPCHFLEGLSTNLYIAHMHTHMLTNPHTQESKQDVEGRAIVLPNCCLYS